MTRSGNTQTHWHSRLHMGCRLLFKSVAKMLNIMFEWRWFNNVVRMECPLASCICLNVFYFMWIMSKLLWLLLFYLILLMLNLNRLKRTKDLKTMEKTVQCMVNWPFYTLMNGEAWPRELQELLNVLWWCLYADMCVWPTKLSHSTLRGISTIYLFKVQWW